MGKNVFVAALVIIVLAAGVWGRRKRRRITRQQAAARWGTSDPPRQLDADDQRDIAAYCRLKSEENPCPVDAITWNDLDMDAVFGEMNRASSNAGEEILYDMLHHTDVPQETLLRRERLRKTFGGDEEARVQVRLTLARLGHGRFHGAHAYLFHPNRKQPRYVRLYLALGLSPLAFVALGFVHPIFFLGIAVMFAVNLFVYYRTDHIFRQEISAVRHIAAMVETARRLSECLPPELADIAEELREQAKRLRAVRRWNALFAMQRVHDLDFLTDYVRILFQLDMICLGKLSACFLQENDSLRTLYALVGEIDACLSVESFATAHETVCTPEFSDEMRLEMRSIVHPLLEAPVSNNLDWTAPVLITGSNASGKSTFIKAVAINAILAQTVALCTAASMRLPRARVMTSMALRDNVYSGESYFVVEVRSLKRILDAASSGSPVLCMIDEILRGTNTTERIAASSALLRSLDQENCMCMAATHDLELTRLLLGYHQLHFKEELNGEGMVFPYTIQEGPSDTRNAIALMKQMGFPSEITRQAESAAKTFDDQGEWDIKQPKS